jgi:hypothetical protein
MEKQRAFLKLGRLGREEVYRHIKVYRPIKEEP